MFVDPNLLRTAIRLVTPETRGDAARALASAFGAEVLLIFQRDPEVKALLAAPGFPQSLPGGKLWRQFLAECADRGHHEAKLPLRAPDERVRAEGWAEGRDLLLVLLGPGPLVGDTAWFRALLPLFGAVFAREQLAATATTRARLASESSTHSAALMQTLDRTRKQLEAALADARLAREELEEANLRLQDQATELELANQNLQDQATELEVSNVQLHEQTEAMEAQAIEMELQTEELQEVNQRLADARAAADLANRAKSEFLATMSHELRTPLNAIGGHLQIIEMGLYGPVTPEQQAALKRIDRSQRHLLGLINNVLNLSRIEAGRVDYSISDVPLADALTDVAPMIEPQLHSKRIEFEVHGPRELPSVRADREKLQQVLLNLLSNAVKFTQNGGRVWIDVSDDRSAGTVAICVADDGRGIPEEKLSSIFDPFVQVDASHSRMGEGTGLGLAISRDLARGMAGDIEVRSEVNVGTVFKLTLPAANAGR